MFLTQTMPALHAPLPLVVFVISVTSVFTMRMFARRRRIVRPAHPSVLRHIKVLVAVPSCDDWNALLWDCIRAALLPQQVSFGVLLECSSVRDANTDVDPILRPCVRMEYAVTQADPNDVAKRVRRLARRFVMQDESYVLFLDYRARLCPSWDRHLTSACASLRADAIVSVPSRSTTSVGYFPCAEMVQGRTRRIESLPFYQPVEYLVPSICWCPELTVGRPAAFESWPPRSCTLEARQTRRLLACPTPLLVDDTRLERLFLESPCACTSLTFAPHASSGWNVGLVDPHDERETIVKFGSSRRAKLARQFGHESIRRSQ